MIYPSVKGVERVKVLSSNGGFFQSQNIGIVVRGHSIKDVRQKLGFSAPSPPPYVRFKQYNFIENNYMDGPLGVQMERGQKAGLDISDHVVSTAM